MAFITLTQNKIAIVDDEDYEKVSQYKWHYSTKTRSVKGYAQRKIKNGDTYMHRFIMNCPKDKVVDHKDGDTLNNKKDNLRICSQSKNMMNKTIMSNNKSGYKGVHFHKLLGRWVAQIKVNDKVIHLGVFDTPEEAFIERNRAAEKYHEEFAR